ncbi:FAD-binding protein [Arabiibacter massiliensis]|uniref:FAD-binding protein n=1 Tax=Arabiibacter massiliensis TaxID=1870985 RepID=UPI00155A89C2|nr:FAD-binding protein [Arabiibacter massiliensis]
MKGAGVAGIGAAGFGLAGLAGCAAPAQDAGANSGGDAGYTFADTVAWNAEYDVVVVGFGGAGGVASAYAADAGARVLVCDKAPLGEEGGNTRFAAQMCVSGTDPDATYRYYQNLAWHFDYDEEMLRTYTDGVCQMEDLLKHLGAEEPTMWKNGTSITPEYPEYDGGEAITEWYAAPGMYNSSLWQLIRKNVTDRADAIDVWLESPAVRLVQDPLSRTVVGVEIDKKGETVLVRAKRGVVLSCGGFENNREMIQDYLGAARLSPLGTLHNNGDGVRMGIEAGAALWHMEAYESLGILSGNAWAVEEGQRAKLEPAKLNPRAPLISLDSELYGDGSILLVGDDGSRFVDENAMHRHGHVYSHGVWRNPVANYEPFLIFDEAKYQELKEAGYIDDEREAKLLKAASPEELAEKMGKDPAIFAQTVADFNAFAEGGCDYTCGRKAESMRSFDGQAYYAAEFRSCVLNTQGGPRRNKNAEVMDTQGNPIPHLYSAGELGGITPFQYNSGGNLAECMVFGKIAGTNAAAEKDELPLFEAPKPVEAAIKYEPGAASDAQPEEAPEVALAAGEYLGVGSGGMGGDITVKVAYADDTIKSIEVVAESETPEIGGKALETLTAEAVAKNTADVDAVSGATLTSTAFMAAVKDAISKA